MDNHGKDEDVSLCEIFISSMIDLEYDIYIIFGLGEKKMRLASIGWI